jgi:hypothetical protein
MAKTLNVQATPEKGTNNKPIAPGETREDMSAKSATGTVVVCCKIPNGLILQCTRWETDHEPVMGGGSREVRIGRKYGPKHVVRGPKIPHGTIPLFTERAGYALTHGIPADFWEEWLKQHKDAPYVQRGLIFAHREVASVTAFCGDNEDVLSGLEPVDPDNLPQGVQTPMHRVDVADEQKRRGTARV